MIHHKKATEEQMIAVIQELIDHGFHLRQVIKTETMEGYRQPGQWPAYLGAVLVLAAEKNLDSLL